MTDTLVEAEQERVSAATLDSGWLTVWERPSPTGMSCGVKAKLLGGRKHYQAYAQGMVGDELKSLESAIYEACDQADVDESKMRWGSIVPEVVQAREMAQAEARTARALMTEGQRSPKDMQALTRPLVEAIWQEMQEYDIQQVEAERQRVYDAEALATFNLWFRGGVVRFGEDAMRRLFQQIPNSTKKTP